MAEKKDPKEEEGKDQKGFLDKAYDNLTKKEDENDKNKKDK
jgi:hypothetical protein